MKNIENIIGGLKISSSKPEILTDNTILGLISIAKKISTTKFLKKYFHFGKTWKTKRKESLLSNQQWVESTPEDK